MNMEKDNNGRIIVGVLLILFGAGLFLSNLEIIPGIKHLIFSWPVIMLILGIIFITNHKNSDTGLVLIIIGSIGLIAKLNHTSFRYILHEYWPVFLIVFGLHLLFRRNNYRVNK